MIWKLHFSNFKITPKHVHIKYLLQFWDNKENWFSVNCVIKSNSLQFPPTWFGQLHLGRSIMNSLGKGKALWPVADVSSLAWNWYLLTLEAYLIWLTKHDIEDFILYLRINTSEKIWRAKYIKNWSLSDYFRTSFNPPFR